MEQEDGYDISKILLIIGGIIALVLGATSLTQIGLRGSLLAHSVYTAHCYYWR